MNLIKYKFWLVTVTVSLFVNLVFAQKSNYQCIWTNHPNDSLKIEDYFYNSSNKVLYHFGNDSKNLYIRLRIPEQVDQIKILQFGLTIWFDENKKTKKVKGIKFPVQEEFEPKNREFENQNKPPRPEMQDNQEEILKNCCKKIQLIGFDNANGQEIPLNNEFYIKTGLHFKNHVLEYSMIVPLKFINQNINDEYILNIGIESGSFNQANRPNRMPDEGMRPEGGPPGNRMGQNEGRPGGGPPGGIRPDNMGQMQHEREAMTKPIEFWIKNVQLSKSN